MPSVHELPLSDRDEGRWLDTHIVVHEAALRSFLKRYLASAAEIADALHDIYGKLLLLSDDERSRIRSPQAYVFAIARNIALDRLRRPRAISFEALTETQRQAVLGVKSHEIVPHETEP